MSGRLRTWIRRIREFAQRLWVRTALIAGLALLAAGLSTLVGPLVPQSWADLVGARAVDDVLHVLASSMLAVTTFSLSVMVTLHRAVSGQWTPRAHRLIARDGTTMTVLATFVGAWLFALVGIIMRWTSAINDGDVVVMFFMTMVVVALIVVTMVRWIAHLDRMGSLSETGGRLEDEARRVLQARMREPCLGGHPLREGREAVPWDAIEVRSDRTGWVRGVFEEALEDAAELAGTDVYLMVPVGRFVHRGEVLALIGAAGEGLADAVRGAIEVGPERSYAQDPRFCLVVMSEIASKALSPGVNDPGTAVEMIGRMVRVLESWGDEIEGARNPMRTRLHVPPLRAPDLIEDAFLPIARHGADAPEVGQHLQRALWALTGHDEPSMAAAARAAAQDAHRRAAAVLDPTDLALLEAAMPRAARRVAA